jgi:allantoinase
MPLNCLPATTTVAALEAKRKASHGQCHVDWASWGGVVPGNHADIPALAAEGVPGFKCFIIHPGIDGFTMVTEQDLAAALPHITQTGLPLLVHAELPGPIEAATANLADADWSRYMTYLRSRPEAAELSAIHLLISLCRKYRFHLHVVHLSASEALPLFRAARSEGLVQMRSSDSQPRKPRTALGRAPGRDDRFRCDRSLALSSRNEAVAGGEFRIRLGRYFEPVSCPFPNVYRSDRKTLFSS